MYPFYIYIYQYTSYVQDIFAYFGGLTHISMIKKLVAQTLKMA
jgi:hypothetical protein